MVCLYVTSVEDGAGKTTICAGLCRHLLDSGKKVGFFKPIIATGEHQGAEAASHDALFMKQILGSDEPVDSICPVISDRSELGSRIKETYARISSGKDADITEAILDLRAKEVAYQAALSSASKVLQMSLLDYM